MAATEHVSSSPSRQIGRFLRWLQSPTVNRFLTVFLAAAAFLAGAGTFAALRGIPPFGSDPDLVLLLLTLDLILLLLLAVVIAWRVAAVWSERRRGSAGSRLHIRLVRLFGVVSVVPVIFVAVFSVLRSEEHTSELSH